MNPLYQFLGILILGGLFLAVLFAYPFFCNFMFRLILKPLEVPTSYHVESHRDKVMTLVVFGALTVWQIGVYILPLTYVIGIWLHVLERNMAARGHPVSELPRIPRVALDELLAMTVSLAGFPLLFLSSVQYLSKAAGIDEPVLQDNTQMTLTAMAVGMMIFPLCFVSALHRLNSNHVPHGGIRMLFVFVYPYIALSAEFALIGPVSIAILALDQRIYASDVYTLIFWTSCLPWLLLFVGARLARRAREMAAQLD